MSGEFIALMEARMDAAMRTMTRMVEARFWDGGDWSPHTSLTENSVGAKVWNPGTGPEMERCMRPSPGRKRPCLCLHKHPGQHVAAADDGAPILWPEVAA